MNAREPARRWIVLCLSVPLIQFSQVAIAQSRTDTQPGDEHWVPTWAAAPQPGRVVESFLVPRAPTSTNPSADKKARDALPLKPIVGLNNQTVRMIIRTSIAGHRVRVQLANTYSATALSVGSAHVAIRRKGSAILPGSDRVLFLGGKASFSIPPGAVVISDPVELDIPQFTDLAVSIYTPGETGPATLHLVGLHDTYVSDKGNAAGQPAIAPAAIAGSWYWLSSVEVLAPAYAAAVATFGDSITDGIGSTPNTDSSWPSQLARRLISNPATSHVAVMNEGISADRLLRDGLGPGGLARFDHDVLAHPGVKWVTVLEGINDIGVGLGEALAFGPRANTKAADNPTPDDLIGAYRQMIMKAHAHGIKVVGCTLAPFEGAGYYSEGGNAIRRSVNEWIRARGVFDAVVDFDAVLRNPKSPNKLRPEFDSGDHLHPNDSGYKAMAQAFDFSTFSQIAKPFAGDIR
jgi:lysophospholipase L1-like esterase